MCLVSIFPSGIDKYSEKIIKNIECGMEANKWGSGFAVKFSTPRDKGPLYLSKGFWDEEGLLKAIKQLELLPEDELIVHHRISTHGDDSAVNCHPFIISSKSEEINTIEGFTNKPILAHNGVFHLFTKNTDKYSDSYWFTKNFMSIPEVLSILRRDPELFKDFFSTKIGGNKIGILFPDREYVKLGYFTEDGGNWHSNDGYKNWRTNNVGGKEVGTKEDVITNYQYGNRQKQLKAFNPNVEDFEDIADTNKGIIRSLKPHLVLNKTIKLTALNWNHFVFICNRTAFGLMEGERFIIKNYLDPDEKNMADMVIIAQIDNEHNLIGKSHIWNKNIKVLMKDFDMTPKVGCIQYYEDLLALEKKLTFKPSKACINKLKKSLSNYDRKTGLVSIKKAGRMDKMSVQLYLNEIKEYEEA